MALSDHEQTILKEMEVALRSDRSQPVSTPRKGSAPSRRPVAVAIGLLIAGFVATMLGLRLQNGLGTAVGVLGFILIVRACWSIHLTPSLRRWATARISARTTPQ
jgi:hypothetical protein